MPIPKTLANSKHIFKSIPHELCWAKTTHDGNPGINVVEHCRNVGYVANALVAIFPDRIRRLFPASTAILAACHDIGKVSPEFQSQCEMWLEKYGLRDRTLREGWTAVQADHAAYSQASLLNYFGKEHLSKWAQIVGAHHGYLKNVTASRHSWEDERRRLLAQLIEEFGPLPTERAPDSTLWLVAGLITIADWIGSDERYFSSGDTHAPTATVVGARAGQALNAIGWRAIQVQPAHTFAKLFPGVITPNSLQLATLRAVQQPGIYVIEAPMGYGKTEAALAAAYTPLSSQSAIGLYFALPTQVTSNRIYERVKQWADRTMNGDTYVRLAHGSSWLFESSPLLHSASQPPQDGQSISSAQSWFSSAKRALFVPLGVGTIDQALLGIIAVKHFFVRQFALAGKVVILDEVHSYDLYTGTLITFLVRRLRELGATVLILSATLTEERRRELLNIEGSDQLSGSYPRVSSVSENSKLIEIPCAPPPSRTVRILRFNESPSEMALRRAQDGACVLWIRNTVKLAQQTFRRLRRSQSSRDVPLGLLHSRFPFFRREQLEEYWITALGKSATTRPRGCILVATQIAEQSVDIDADLLISDLAPTDMLLQRLGRLWRHKREQRPCETPEVWIEMPSFDALGAHGKVYAPYVLLRSAEQWCQLESITLPDDIRRVLEATYSAPREDEPQEWKRLYEELEAKKRKLREYASSTTFVWQKCSLNDEESVSTRWSEVQTASLVLIRTQGNRSWTFLDGSTAVVTADWNFYAAQAIHRNLARVPYWMLTASDTSALRGYVPGTASLGIVGESGAIQLMGSNEESLVYDAQLGIISASHEPSE